MTETKFKGGFIMSKNMQVRNNDIDRLETGYGNDDIPMINNPLASIDDIMEAYNEYREESEIDW